MILLGDCIEMMRDLDADSVDAVVTDPPYGIAFMGKQWDQPGQFGSTRRNGTPAKAHREGNDGAGAMDAGRYDLSAAAMVNFQRWCQAWATECLRVLKPGGHLLAFGGSRTWHRLAAGIEDAGFELRDSIAWLYGSGFPKSSKPYRRMAPCPSTERAPHAVRLSEWHPLVSPAEKAPIALALAEMQPGGDPALLIRTGAAGDSSETTAMSWSALTELTSLNTVTSWSSISAESWIRESKSTIATVIEATTASKIWKSLTSSTTRTNTPPDVSRPPGCACSVATVVSSSTGDATNKPPTHTLIAPERAIAPVWWAEGLGTAAKPAFEPIVVARKPLIGTVAANVLAHGTGALNIDACRIETSDNLNGGAYAVDGNREISGSLNPSGMNRPGATANGDYVQPSGRWPANVILDESQAAALDEQSGDRPGSRRGIMRRGSTTGRSIGGEGTYGSARPQDAVGGYDDSGGASRFFYCAKASKKERPKVNGVSHPTVKPQTLMRWLVRLVTPPNGVVLDPFAGSGATLEAARDEGFDYIGIERELDYARLIDARLGLTGEFADPMDQYEDELI